MAGIRAAALSLLFVGTALGNNNPVPTPLPARPTPNWSWDTLPIAFHGANRSGVYTDADLKQLSRYLMVTLEKWYTPCAAQGPQQAGPECDVEAKMFTTFKQLKALSPQLTTVMYWNSMFDFAFYAWHQKMVDLEANGQHAFFRNASGSVAELCNDGNVYCNITTYDHTQEAVRHLWFRQVQHAVAHGNVDGIFADHGNSNPSPVKGSDYWQLCNGKRPQRACFNVTPEFGARFVAAHMEMLNYTQDWLSNNTGGPVICGPYARWRLPTDFRGLRNVTQEGLKDPTAPFVIEASKGACDLAADEAKLAGFLCAMEKYTYLACFHSAGLPQWYPAYDKPLGAPTGPAELVGGSTSVWQRKFSNPKGVTIATYNEETGEGSVQWAGEPTSIQPSTLNTTEKR